MKTGKNIPCKLFKFAEFVEMIEMNNKQMAKQPPPKLFIVAVIIQVIANSVSPLQIIIWDGILPWGCLLSHYGYIFSKGASPFDMYCFHPHISTHNSMQHLDI